MNNYTKFRLLFLSALNLIETAIIFNSNKPTGRQYFIKFLYNIRTLYTSRFHFKETKHLFR